MSNVFNRETKQYLKSVNTPDYDRPTGKHWEDGTWIINPIFVPKCDSKYMVVEGNDIREMTLEEKAVIDYVAPIPEPEPLTAEELEKERNKNIADEIAIKYPLSAELALNWKIHAGELTMISSEIVEFRNTVNLAKAKYPKM